MKLAAAIITNRLKLNSILVESLFFADEIIIVVDSSNGHSDRPARRGGNTEITNFQSKKTKIFYHSLNSDFAAQRNFALEQTRADWVLFVDNDEYVSTELKQEIQNSIHNSKFSGYFIHRTDVVFHQPLKNGETGKIKILRLARRNAGKFSRSVHEVWKIKGRVGELSAPLYHQKDHFISGFINRMDSYGSIDAGFLNSENKPFSWIRLFFNPPAKFILNYFFRAGFLDGLVGLFLAYLMAVQSLSVRVFQWENKI